MYDTDAEAGKELEVNLETQQVVREDGSSIPFEVDSFRRHCLLNGLDDIGLTMQKMDAIRAFEAVRSDQFPWLDGATTRVPKLMAVGESAMPIDTPSHNLNTPSPEEWRVEVIARHKLRQ